MKFNNIPICVFLSCDNVVDRMKNGIGFQRDGIWVNWWSVSAKSNVRILNYTNILARLTLPVSVVINLECDQATEVMNEISSRRMFHYERFWLMFGRNRDEAFAILQNQFINVDAEIYLALPSASSQE